LFCGLIFDTQQNEDQLKTRLPSNKPKLTVWIVSRIWKEDREWITEQRLVIQKHCRSIKKHGTATTPPKKFVPTSRTMAYNWNQT
jgi:hypothetical protein